MRKVNKSFLIGLVALGGVIINVAAPGNYVRHALFDEKVRPLASAGGTLLRVNSVILSEFGNGLILVVMVISFIIVFQKLTDRYLPVGQPAVYRPVSRRKPRVPVNVKIRSHEDYESRVGIPMGRSEEHTSELQSPS